MKKINFLTGCLVLLTVFSSVLLAAKRECREGIWDVAATGKMLSGEEYTSTATSTRYCLFDGDVEFDEYRALSPEGNVVFIGASFHFWTDEGSHLNTLWVMGGDPGYTLITGQQIDNRVTTTGHGIDAGGEFIERFVETHSEDRNYTFDMDRSYDGGQTWTNGFSSSVARFRSAEVPDLPSELHTIVQQAKNTLNLPDQGIPIMDGFGEVEAIETLENDVIVRKIRFSSRYMGPDRWRSVYWVPGSDEIVEVENLIEE